MGRVRHQALNRKQETQMNPTGTKEHMEVVGTDGKHVGIVDHLDGDRLKLTHHDLQAGGKHHFLPLSAAEAQWAEE